MLNLGGKIVSLLRFLSDWATFFSQKAELKLSLFFDDKNYLQVFAYLAKIYIYNIQITTPPLHSSVNFI